MIGDKVRFSFKDVWFEIGFDIRSVKKAGITSRIFWWNNSVRPSSLWLVENNQYQNVNVVLKKAHYKYIDLFPDVALDFFKENSRFREFCFKNNPLEHKQLIAIEETEIILSDFKKKQHSRQNSHQASSVL